MRTFKTLIITLGLALIVAVGFLGTRTFAGRIPGGGSAKSDCYVEFEVRNVSGPSNHITCTDGDPACDTDGMCQGICTFDISLCVNQTLAGCTAKPPLGKLKVSQPGSVPLPSDLSSTNCGSSGSVTVPVKKRGNKTKPGKKKIRALATVTGKPKTDKDSLFLVCTPRQGACPTTTSTTVTTTTATTTTTMLPHCVGTGACTGFTKLSVSTLAGTTSCGSGGLVIGPAAPLSGEIDSDTAGTTKIADLGLGCLYFGGGSGTTVPPGAIPDSASSIYATPNCNGNTVCLEASSGTSLSDCTMGAGPAKHCVNDGTNAQCTAATAPYPCCTGAGTGTCPRSCAADSDCAGSGSTTACQLDANCFFGPPLPVKPGPPAQNLATCVLNVIQKDSYGSSDSMTGASITSMVLSSRVYLTANQTSPCPKCLSGTCNTGANAGGTCKAVGSLMTTTDCLPDFRSFQAPLAVDLTPLTTGTASKSAPDGVLCPNQSNDPAHVGAFGLPNARTIKESGMPAGNLGDLASHGSHLGSVFCIPSTGNVAVDAVSDIPGPGAIGLNVNAQLLP